MSDPRGHLSGISRGGRIEIFRHLFASIAEEMGVTLQRAAYSPNIKERLDYSCALFDTSGELIAQAMHIPVHLGALGAAVAHATCELEPKPGDVVVLNDPFAGGSHLPDVTMVMPMFAEIGGAPELVGFAANRAHHADVGGMTPGSMPSGTSIFQEGIRIPPVRLVKAGELDQEIFRLLLANVRGPEERRGDLRAQHASCRVGARRYVELLARFGREEVLAARDELLAYSARSMQHILAELPDGDYAFEDVLDDDGHGARDLPLRVTIRIRGDRAEIDFAGTAPACRGCVNATRAVTVACVHYAFHCLAAGDIPANEGAIRPLEIRIPKGSLLDARYPHAVVAGNVETSQRVVDVLLGALAQAAPTRIPAASSGSMNTITLGGNTSAGGRQGEWSYVETLGGGMGGRPDRPGLSGVHTHMTNTRNTPVEALEHAYPLRVRTYRLREASGGAGRNAGGNGLIREIEALAPCEGSLLAERRRTSPYGLSGGQPGSPGRDTIRRREGAEETLPSKCNLHLEPGDVLRIETPGGGGHG